MLSINQHLINALILPKKSVVVVVGALGYAVYAMKIRSAMFRIIRIAGIGILTLIFLMSTSPVSIPAALLVAPFIGLFTFLYLIGIEFMRFLGPDEDENGALIRLRRPRVMAALLAGFPVLLLALQSVVELSVWDVTIACVILLLAYVYAARGSVLVRK